MATKKSGGSSRNGRDSIGRRLGIKRNHLQTVNAGEIIIRQRGTVYYPGTNIGLGKDHTLYALINGVIKFATKIVNHKRKTIVSVTAE